MCGGGESTKYVISEKNKIIEFHHKVAVNKSLSIYINTYIFFNINKNWNILHWRNLIKDLFFYYIHPDISDDVDFQEGTNDGQNRFHIARAWQNKRQAAKKQVKLC